MTTGHTGDGALPPELEAIATAAHDRLHAQAGQDLPAEQDAPLQDRRRRTGVDGTVRAILSRGTPTAKRR